MHISTSKRIQLMSHDWMLNLKPLTDRTTSIIKHRVHTNKKQLKFC